MIFLPIHNWYHFVRVAGKDGVEASSIFTNARKASVTHIFDWSPPKVLQAILDMQQIIPARTGSVQNTTVDRCQRAPLVASSKELLDHYEAGLYLV